MNESTRGVLYYLHNGDGEPRYIGITIQKPEYRLNKHLRTAERGINRPVSSWIRKYGSESIKMVIILEADVQALRDLEISLIAQLRQTGRCLNYTDGGEGGNTFGGRQHTPEAKEKIRLARVGSKATSETKAKLSAQRQGRVSWNKGIPQSPERNKAQSELMKSRPNPTLAIGRHTRWHTNRNIIKPDCAYCSTETLEMRQNV